MSRRYSERVQCYDSVEARKGLELGLELGVTEEKYKPICSVDMASELAIYLSDYFIYIKINICLFSITASELL